MNERIRELSCRAGEYTDFEVGICTDEFLEKFAEMISREARLHAIEEVRQKLKWADWPIGCVSIVERACEELSAKEHFGIEEE